MKVQINEHEYYVRFQQNHSRKFENGRDDPRVRTMCKIFVLWMGQWLLAAVGTTTLGFKDKHNRITGYKFALRRALAGLDKATRTRFWEVFHKTFPRVGSKLQACPRRVKAKGHGEDWCVVTRKACASSEACDTILKKAVQRVAENTARRVAEKKKTIRRVAEKKARQFAKRVSVGAYRNSLFEELPWVATKEPRYRYRSAELRQSEDRMHRRGEPVPLDIKIINKLDEKETLRKLDENAIYRIMYGRRSFTDKHNDALNDYWRKQDLLADTWSRWVRFWSWLKQRWDEDTEVRQARENVNLSTMRLLYKRVQESYCVQCRRKTTWCYGPGPKDNSVTCSKCGQEYWLDHGGRTAKRFERKI